MSINFELKQLVMAERVKCCIIVKDENICERRRNVHITLDVNHEISYVTLSIIKKKNRNFAIIRTFVMLKM
jgi:hypothetical protein